MNEGIALIEALAGRQLAVERADREHGDVKATCADTARARGDLGFEAAISFETGLERQFEWFQERNGGA